MGGAFLERPGPVRALLDRASRALALDVAAAVARGSPALLRTEVGQAALTAVCIGLAQERAASGGCPDAVAGHSLGELTAFCIAGYLEPEEAIDCAVARGKLMADAARRSPGGMAAVRIREKELFALLESADGRLEIAAHNAPEEWVLSGDHASLAALAARLATAPLPVSGPWHSRAMAEAQARWRETLHAVRWKRPTLALVANATGAFVTSEDPAELLAGQLTRPVRWAATLCTLAAAGVSDWSLIGPARALRGLCRANLSASARVAVDNGPADWESP
jgi:[acyl-carrier-protein] S-malonyltransferase